MDTQEKQREGLDRPTSGTITRLVIQERDAGRVSVFLDNQFAFGVHQDLIIQFGLLKGTLLTGDDVQAILEAEGVLKARAKALRYLGFRARTMQEMRLKLSGAGFAPETVENVIDWLRSYGYLDDEAFARDYAAARFRSKGYGPSRIRMELIKKGVPSIIAEESVATLMLEEDPVAAARSLAEKKWSRLEREPDLRRRTKKVFDFLMRRGYPSTVIRQVIEEVRRSGR